VSPLTVPPIANELVVQATAMFVTFPAVTFPLPFVIVHVWLGLVGCVFTATW
jgi:hypothetical protein